VTVVATAHPIEAVEPMAGTVARLRIAVARCAAAGGYRARTTDASHHAVAMKTSDDYRRPRENSSRSNKTDPNATEP
jgi:hypothetical protein